MAKTHCQLVDKLIVNLWSVHWRAAFVHKHKLPCSWDAVNLRHRPRGLQGAANLGKNVFMNGARQCELRWFWFCFLLSLSATLALNFSCRMHCHLAHRPHWHRNCFAGRTAMWHIARSLPIWVKCLPDLATYRLCDSNPPPSPLHLHVLCLCHIGVLRWGLAL